MTSNAIRDRINALSAKKTQDELDERDSHILMANYLSEVERIKHITGLKGKELAKKVNISHSYLSQVFRGVKPLNFLTIAKIQRVLGIKFTVKVNAQDNSLCIVDDEMFLKNIQQYRSSSKGTWIYKSISFTTPNYQEIIELKEKTDSNESKVKSA